MNFDINYLNHNFEIIEPGYCYCRKCQLDGIYYTESITGVYIFFRNDGELKQLNLSCEDIIIKNIIE